MTKTATAPRYYVARTNGTIARYATLADAKTTAKALYEMGVVAPLVVVAADRDAALVKAQRCYRGEIRIAEARKA
jgi:hypothetical protein